MRRRLQRILADAGLASRRGAETWIREGRVTIDGRPATLGESVDPEHAQIHVDGEPLRIGRRSYWLLNKPRGVLSTTRDPHARASGKRTVLELLPRAARAQRLYPVGRLDLESEGLLLLTNDGEATQALLHPSLGAEKEYRVTVKGELPDAAARKLARGPRLADGPMAPCRVGGLRRTRDGATTFTLTLQEGRKRQVRRAMLALGHPVLRLKRVRMGPLQLGRLEPGRARELRPEERQGLLAAVRHLLESGAKRAATGQGQGQGAAREQAKPRAGGGPKAKTGRREAGSGGPTAKSARRPARPANAPRGRGTPRSKRPAGKRHDPSEAPRSKRPADSRDGGPKGKGKAARPPGDKRRPTGERDGRSEAPPRAKRPADSRDGGPKDKRKSPYHTSGGPKGKRKGPVRSRRRGRKGQGRRPGR